LTLSQVFEEKPEEAQKLLLYIKELSNAYNNSKKGENGDKL
jgi:hypothetical protein